MDKLYWIVCEESDRTLFEGRYLGRTRGAALKHLKDQLGRTGLNGLVFTITEIPVPLIREIVAEVLGQGGAVVASLPEVRPMLAPQQPGRFEAFSPPPQEPERAPEPTPFQDTEPRPQYDWDAIKACYLQGRGPKDVARLMDVPLNTLKGRITREGWAAQRRGVG